MKYIPLFSTFMTLSLATLSLACTDEVLEHEAFENKETFRIIEYGLPDIPAARAIHDQLPPNQRISSLTYLLYDYNGNLLKEREIPDIDAKTVWPLQRATMTWEQREALKDTLENNRSYHVAFVANTGTGSGWTVSPLKNKADFHQAYLELPEDQAFGDHNLFYFSTYDIEAEALQVDRETPYNCPVVLQRVVSRMDFWCEKMPEWTIENEANIKTYLEPRFLSLYTQLINGESPFLRNNTKESALQLVVDLETYYKQKKNETDNSNTVQLQEYDKILTNLSTIKTELNANTTSVEAALRNKEATPLIEQLWKDCLLSTALQTAWTKSWQNAKVVRLKYDGTSGAGQLKLSDRTTTASQQNSALLPMDLSATTAEDGVKQTFVGFNWIGFGLDKQEITAIQAFADASNTTTPTIELTPSIPLMAPNGTNKRLVVYYIPVHTLACTQGAQVKETVLSCDPYQLLCLEQLETQEQELMNKAIREALMNSDLAKYKYQETQRTDPNGHQEVVVKLIQLPLSIPDLTQRLEVRSNWEVTEQK